MCRYHSHCFHRACSSAFTASAAEIQVNLSNKVCGMDGLHASEPPGCYHGFTAAAAAIADEINLLSYVFTELDQVMFVGRLEQVASFDDVNLAGYTMAD